MIAKREREKGLDRSKMVVFSNYFFDTTQGHSQINGATVRNVYIKEAFDTTAKHPFKGNFDLEKIRKKAFKRREHIMYLTLYVPLLVTLRVVSQFLLQT